MLRGRCSKEGREQPQTLAIFGPNGGWWNEVTPNRPCAGMRQESRLKTTQGPNGRETRGISIVEGTTQVSSTLALKHRRIETTGQYPKALNPGSRWSTSCFCNRKLSPASFTAVSPPAPAQRVLQLDRIGVSRLVLFATAASKLAETPCNLLEPGPL